MQRRESGTRFGARLHSAAVCCALALAFERPALADDAADARRAQSLFEQGRKLAKSGHYEEARARFEQSVALVDGVGAEFNLADCLEHLGQLERARALFLEVASRTHASGQLERERVARERAAAIPAEGPGEPSEPVASVPEIVVAAPSEPTKPAPARVLAEQLRQETGALADADAALRALDERVALLARKNPKDPRLTKLQRELRGLKRDLTVEWQRAGRASAQLALRFGATIGPVAAAAAAPAARSEGSATRAVPATPAVQAVSAR